MSDIRSANVGQEVRRPLSLALLALALLGWIVAIWAIASNASSTRSYTARIEAVRGIGQRRTKNSPSFNERGHGRGPVEPHHGSAGRASAH